MSYFSVDLFTPFAVMEKEVSISSLLVPTSTGQINILPEHTHIITNLTNGFLYLFRDNNESPLTYLVSHGICKLLQNRIQILTPTAELASEITLESAEKALAELEKILANPKIDQFDFIKYSDIAERETLRMKMAKGEIPPVKQ